jgi:hypothetical protein
MRRLRHVLLLVWLIASALWIGLCLWTLDFSCIVGSGGPWCDQLTGPPLRLPYGVGAIVVTFGIPIVALLAGAIIFIVIQAFRRKS